MVQVVSRLELQSVGLSTNTFQRKEDISDIPLTGPLNELIVDEFTPEEFGVWHPSLNAFIPIDYLGTSMFNGKASAHADCVKGMNDIFHIKTCLNAH